MTYTFKWMRNLSCKWATVSTYKRVTNSTWMNMLCFTYEYVMNVTFGRVLNPTSSSHIFDIQMSSELNMYEYITQEWVINVPLKWVLNPTYPWATFSRYEWVTDPTLHRNTLQHTATHCITLQHSHRLYTALEPARCCVSHPKDTL